MISPILDNIILPGMTGAKCLLRHLNEKLDFPLEVSLGGGRGTIFLFLFIIFWHFIDLGVIVILFQRHGLECDLDAILASLGTVHLAIRPLVEKFEYFVYVINAV